MGRPTKFTPDRRAIFLESLELYGEISGAAASAGVSRQTAYATARADPEFADQCEHALGKLNLAKMEAFRKLAVEGVEKTTYDKDGNVSSRTRVRSERLLLAWMKRHAPADWGDKLQVDKTVTTREEVSIRDLPLDAKRKLRIALDAVPDAEPEP